MLEGSLYRNIVGSLLYIANRTRPDIMTAVSILTQFVSAPNNSLWKAALRVLRYLRGTREYVLVFNGCSDYRLQGYVDADFGQNTVTRKSRTGFMLRIYNSKFDWSSKKQTLTALSTSQAETYAASECARSLLFASKILMEMGLFENKLEVYCDNALTIGWANGTVSRKTAEHIDIRHHFLKEYVENKGIEFKKIHGSVNPGDAFTKPLDKIKFQLFREEMGVKLDPNLSSRGSAENANYASGDFGYTKANIWK